MISGSPPASSSSVAGTAPSTEFSSGTSAASASLLRTASIASVTFVVGRRVAPAETGSARSAAWANVPSGPRNAIVAMASSLRPRSARFAAQQATPLGERRRDGLLLLGGELVLALAVGD